MCLSVLIFSDSLTYFMPVLIIPIWLFFQYKLVIQIVGILATCWKHLQNYLVQIGTRILIFFIIKFLLGYIHYPGGFTVTILISLILHLIYIAPLSPLLQPSPHHS
jgi:hypothetical protein